MQSSAVLPQTISPARNYHQDWFDNSNTAILELVEATWKAPPTWLNSDHRS